MKRVFSFIMLLMMLFTSFHPTLAMRYCGGMLQSVALFSHSSSHSCCKQTSQGVIKHPEKVNENKTMQISGTECCNTAKILLTTDEYQLRNREIDTASPSFSFHCLTVALRENLGNLQQVKTLVPYEFPPGGLFFLQTDLLTFIGIYRI